MNTHSKYPKTFVSNLSRFNVTLTRYEEWVAGHEAAHCAVAIIGGGSVQYVDLTFQGSGRSFSRARAVANGLTTRLAQLNYIAAGAAYDELLVSSNALPKELASQVNGDRVVAGQYLRSELKPNPTLESTIDRLWDDVVAKQKSTLDLELRPQLLAIKAVILREMEAGANTVSGAMIHQAYLDATPASSDFSA